jgi:hypothetical protein
VGTGRGDTRTADAIRETPPCPLTLTHAHIKRGHVDHACIHPWLRLVLDLRARTGKKVLTWPAPPVPFITFAPRFLSRALPRARAVLGMQMAGKPRRQDAQSGL